MKNTRTNCSCEKMDIGNLIVTQEDMLYYYVQCACCVFCCTLELVCFAEEENENGKNIKVENIQWNTILYSILAVFSHV